MSTITLRAFAEAIVPQTAADLLTAFCSRTGQAWGPNADDRLFWYRPPKVHILEFVILHLFVCVCFLASRGYAAHSVRQVNIRAPSHKPLTSSRLNSFLGIVMLCCWFSQLFFKSIRPNVLVQLGWLLMPCHLLTLLWSAALFMCGSPGRHGWSVYLATLAADYHWSPMGAIAWPDWGDHQYRIEGHIFMLHHVLLSVLPVYFAARYYLLPMTTQRLLHVTALATFINVGPYTLCSYLSGLNINYMLYPPPKLMGNFPFTSVAYRFYVILILILLTVAHHFLIDGAGRVARWSWLNN